MKKITIVLAVIMSLTISCKTEIKEEVKPEVKQEVVEKISLTELWDKDSRERKKVEYVMQSRQLNLDRRLTEKEGKLLDSLIEIKKREDKINNALFVLDSIDMITKFNRDIKINETINKASDSIRRKRSKEDARETLSKIK